MLYDELKERKDKGEKLDYNLLEDDEIIKLSIDIPDATVAELFDLKKSQVRYIRKKRGINNIYILGQKNNFINQLNTIKNSSNYTDKEIINIMQKELDLFCAGKGYLPFDINKFFNDTKENDNLKKANILSDEELEKKIFSRNTRTSLKRKSSININSRNPYIVEYTLRRAKGICDLCGENAPFSKFDGTPYLESHHVMPLSEGGEDSILNTVALCPNCHRRMHILKDENDNIMIKLKLKMYENSTLKINI